MKPTLLQRFYLWRLARRIAKGKKVLARCRCRVLQDPSPSLVLAADKLQISIAELELAADQLRKAYEVMAGLRAAQRVARRQTFLAEVHLDADKSQRSQDPS